MQASELVEQLFSSPLAKVVALSDGAGTARVVRARDDGARALLVLGADVVNATLHEFAKRERFGTVKQAVVTFTDATVLLSRLDETNTIVVVAPSDVGKRQFARIEVHPRGWVDPAEAGPVTPPRPPDDGGGLSALQIVTIVGTVALASGIAVGGSYLLFGRDNPRGLDSAEGAIVVTTELLLIGAGTVIAIVSD